MDGRDKKRSDEISNIIIGCAIEVHRIIGPGALESTYERCLCYELGQKGLKFEKQKDLPIIYKEVRLDGGYRVDILVENLVILELKAVECIEEIHKAQLLSYLKLSDLWLGLLINFNVQILKNGIIRIVN